MKQNVTESGFIQAFDDMNRGNNFSYEGRMALYEYFQEYEESCSIDVDLDVIAICCEYAEYESLAEFQGDYGQEYESLEDIEDRTQVIKIDDDAFIILSF